MGVPLSLVTLTYNNVDEARRTIASVALQKIAPTRFFVIDSSDSEPASQIENLARRVGALYRWVEPRGVYPAMNEAVMGVPDDDFVWFINSSDWLAGPDSVGYVNQGLAVGHVWAVGGLERLGDTRTPFHPIPSNAEAFLDLLQSGKIGFPHPSAVMSRRLIVEVGGFSSDLKIAADYQLALMFAKAVGAPKIIAHTLSVHVPTGLTSQNKVRHAWEKSRARLRTVEGVGWWDEVRLYLSALASFFGVSGYWKKVIRPFPVGQAFGQELDSWPDGPHEEP